MCKSVLHPFLVDLPKCEHHMHLEGALSPSLLFKLAARNNISLPKTEEDNAFESTNSLLDRYARFTSLDDFLHYYFIGMSTLIHKQDFEELALDYFKRAKSDGVVHAEVFFDPQAHTSRGVEYETVVAGFKEACLKAEREYDISTELILCFLRHLPVDDAQQHWELARPDLTEGKLSGIGLDSSEKDFPPGLWKSIYSTAASEGIRRTAHAGEEGPANYIREAIEECRVQRIDHGIRLVDDEKLLQLVAREKILVTVCPLSNLRLQCVSSVRLVPIRRFLESGVAFSINSNDPAYFTSYIQDNYCAVQDAFDLSMEEWSHVAMSAIEGSWCSGSRKQELRDKLNEVIQRHAR